MVLHKMVNGIKVNLTPEEEEKIRAEWEQNRIKHEQEMLEKQQEKAAKETLRNSAIAKLKKTALLSDDEIGALLNG